MGKIIEKTNPKKIAWDSASRAFSGALLDILDKHGVKATVITSGLMAELFPETVVEAKRRGHEIATHHWDQTIHTTVYRTNYEEAQRHPMKFRYSMHNFTGGRPGLAKTFERFLEYAKGFPGVWFGRCIDMANYWLEQESLYEQSERGSHKAA